MGEFMRVKLEILTRDVGLRGRVLDFRRDISSLFFGQPVSKKEIKIKTVMQSAAEIEEESYLRKLLSKAKLFL